MKLDMKVLEQTFKPKLKVNRYKVQFKSMNHLGKVKTLTTEFDLPLNIKPTTKNIMERFAELICAGSHDYNHYLEFYDCDMDYEVTKMDYKKHKDIYLRANNLFFAQEDESYALQKFISNFFDEDWLHL